ncbi:hypothetical protein NHQ30_006445 [Ciborinia camelliae]|nr:hypothetical protein NHQ30_006445 [Ciborinia camelliae]
MSPDPRQFQSHNRQSSEFLFDWVVSRYLNWNVEAETHDVEVRAQNVTLPDAISDDGFFHLSDPVLWEILPADSVEILVRIVAQRLIPHFWLRVIRGETPSLSSRILIVRLRRIMIMNQAYHHFSTITTDHAWRLAIGHPGDGFDLVELALDREEWEDCGICREPLNEVRSNGMPVRTTCNHEFHQQCIKEWLEHSNYKDCPACRTAILRLGNPPPPFDSGPRPEWLTNLIPSQPQLARPLRLVSNQEMYRLEVAVLQARREALATYRDVNDIEREVLDARIRYVELEHRSISYEDERRVAMQILLPGDRLSEEDFALYQSRQRDFQQNIEERFLDLQLLMRQRQRADLLFAQAEERSFIATRAFQRVQHARAQEEGNS